jgi:hypothetical protein
LVVALLLRLRNTGFLNLFFDLYFGSLFIL